MVARRVPIMQLTGDNKHEKIIMFVDLSSQRPIQYGWYSELWLSRNEFVDFKG